MTRICWWMVGIMSRALEPSEREVVYGDLAESDETAWQAFHEVLGLVVRRQAVLWKSWRPWLALVSLAIPLATLLCGASRRTADGSAIYIWLYANNWDWVFVGNAGFRQEFAHYAGIIFIQYLILFGLSWTIGFVLGFVSRRSSPVTSVLFGLMLLIGGFLRPPFLGNTVLSIARDFQANAAVFELMFYRVMFPLIVQAALVLIPSLWGMRQGLRASLRFKENI